MDLSTVRTIAEHACHKALVDNLEIAYLWKFDTEHPEENALAISELAPLTNAAGLIVLEGVEWLISVDSNAEWIVLKRFTKERPANVVKRTVVPMPTRNSRSLEEWRQWWADGLAARGIPMRKP